MFIDTHTHIYSEQFDIDRNEAIKRAISKNIKIMLLPAIDKGYSEKLINCTKSFPKNCLPMLGLHPTSVKENYKEEIDFIKSEITNYNYIAIGETGLDYYWSQTFVKEQEIVLREQIELAINYNLPIVLHSRNSLNEIFDILKDYRNNRLNGVFHCFPGNTFDAEKVIELGFFLGIGGVVTYKNSIMAEVVKNISLEYFILETDSPYLSPVPYRGKRNESANIKIIAEKISEIKQISISKVEEITTCNTIKLFNLKNV
ncbi:MAG: hydrolase TatD [Bacteroidetes bacterium GWA2_32_17]|nr:MAG: hydrolase TatD [Bacteroidetes bacterium GWA2_32_17]